jgi:hypothetical protein
MDLVFFFLLFTIFIVDTNKIAYYIGVKIYNCQIKFFLILDFCSLNKKKKNNKLETIKK